MANSTEARSFLVVMGEAVALLPKSQQQFVSRMIETVLAQAGAR
jgi:hypothetical protein